MYKGGMTSPQYHPGKNHLYKTKGHKKSATQTQTKLNEYIKGANKGKQFLHKPKQSMGQTSIGMMGASAPTHIGGAPNYSTADQRGPMMSISPDLYSPNKGPSPSAANQTSLMHQRN